MEDNVDAAETLCETLELAGHEAEAAFDGPAAIRKAMEFRPDVVLCDIGLPGMPGHEVARAFRADPSLRTLYLVALSGYALPGDLLCSQEAGFDRHLAKPASLEHSGSCICGPGTGAGGAPGRAGRLAATPRGRARRLR